MVLLPVLIGRFFVLKVNRPTEPHGLSGEIIISKCVIVLVIHNPFYDIYLCYKDAIKKIELFKTKYLTISRMPKFINLESKILHMLHAPYDHFLFVRQVMAFRGRHR